MVGRKVERRKLQAISPQPVGRTASGRARMRQDAPPTMYMHTPSEATDAAVASPEAVVPLRRNRPHADKALNTSAHPHANEIAQWLGMLRRRKKKWTREVVGMAAWILRRTGVRLFDIIQPLKVKIKKRLHNAILNRKQLNTVEHEL